MLRMYHAGMSCVLADEMACRFALNDCTTGGQALSIVKRFGSPLYVYQLMGPLPGAPEPELLALSLAALSALEAEIERLKAVTRPSSPDGPHRQG